MVGLLQSSPNLTYTLDFYANQAADPTGFGEGQWPLGSAVVTTTASGLVTFTITLPVTTATDSFLTATATDPTGNTSEFSQVIPCQMRPSDVDLNGVVNILDIQQVAGDFGNAAFPLTHDLDCSQAIDVQDVILVALAWP